ncbi:potassium channel family protein [Bacillus sp. Marseille-P3661]|uniref:potassium channel family protein n=1 Tax=Bacillus sp. Marseille-P3661 TaxID=1936234 RepID=UPI0021552E84|nr:potassium channel family protein [Bacillus sp. Marseille-P3661]
MMLYLGIAGITTIIYKSLQWVWSSHLERERGQYLTFENFLLLILTYVILVTGFGCIYAIMQYSGMGIIIENGEQVQAPFLELLETTTYFSAVTLFSVGYGDIVPLGMGRWIAIFEALIGYILPAAFVMRTVIYFEDSLLKKDLQRFINRRR